MLLIAIYVPDTPIFFVFDPLLGRMLVNDAEAPIALGKEIGPIRPKIIQLPGRSNVLLSFRLVI